MKIGRVEAIPVRIPFAQLGPPLKAFGRPFTAFELLLVRVETEDGAVGWGEAPWGFPRPIQAVIDDFIAPVLVGRDMSDVPALMLDLQRLVYILGRYGVTMCAVSAVDIALWDIKAKAAGVPLFKLLGGSGTRVPGYVSVWAGKGSGEAYDAEKQKFDWDSADQDVVAGQTHGALASGFRHIKLHSTSERDLRVVREVAGPDVRISMDASCRWSPSEAHEAATRLKQYDLQWLEEPIFPPEDFAALARLQAETGVPLAAGENASTEYEFAAMLSANAVKVAQPNVTRVGGVTEFLKVIALAARHGVEVCPFSSLFGPGFVATLHLMGAQERPGLVERVTAPLEASLYGDALAPSDGHFAVPAGPGLGCDPDPEVVRSYRMRP